MKTNGVFLPMLISCIIPTRDRSLMVQEAIASVVDQRRDDLEIIVVDDGSVDGTLDVLEKRYPSVGLIRLNGLGPGPARNAGVRASTGEVIMFLDSDDCWLADHAQALIDLLGKGYEAAYGTTRTLDQVNGGEFLIPECGAGIQGDCLPELLRWCSMVPSSFALTREAFDEIGGFDVQGKDGIGEDWDFFIRLASRFEFGFAGRAPITIRRLHQGSLCRLSDHRKILDLVRRLRDIIRELPETDSVAMDRFHAMEQMIIQRGEQWTTVQDWYEMAKKQGML
ncbi:MAG: glycosyltransferase family 2 protein [Proteobacteria bacterium]|nr:glycosyltransferase family 2 protein [Pseudomonadota bacterium]MBU1711100.1 glycosyltransferase family 2 protein [Pseudomonadota bacterium]